MESSLAFFLAKLDISFSSSSLIVCVCVRVRVCVSRVGEEGLLTNYTISLHGGFIGVICEF